jgi:hypothetical protein
MARARSKDGIRSIHLHNKDAILYVEAVAQKKNCALYEAVESIIHDSIRDELNEPFEKEIKEVTVGSMVVDFYGYGMVLDVLIKNGYTVTLDAVSDRDMKITFKKERVNE